MNRTVVASSNIQSVGYDAESLTLEVEFLAGSIYQYFDVPAQIYDALIGADSVGVFFAANVRGVYRYARV